MAPKSSIRSHQPSKEKEEEEEREESSSSGEEEEEEEEDVSEAKENSETEEASDDETEEDDEGKTQGTLNKSKSPKNPVPNFEAKFDSDRDDSEGSPSDYKLQPIHKGSVSSSKRKGNQDSLRSSKSSKTDEKKSASSTPGAGAGAGAFTRLWSDDDEITVLNGMIEFKTVKGLDPSADMGAFHSFVKGKLEVDFTRDQLRTKITRMKKRFLNALKKGGKKGSDPVFSKPHEDMAFEISKKIWGRAAAAAAAHSNGNVKRETQKVEKDVLNEREVVEEENGGEGGDFWSKYPYFNASFGDMKGKFPSLTPGAGISLMKEKLSLIGNAKAKELDDKWKQLSVEEMNLSCKILTLMKEQVEMALDE